MRFPENILAKDEKVVRSLHPHWLTLVIPAVIGLLIIAATWLIVAMTPVDDTWNIVDWVIIAIAVLLFIGFVVVPFLRWRTTHYVITSNRVVVRRGILAKSGQDIALSKITDVSFRQSLLDRILRSGSLQIETAGDSQDEEFSNIPRSNQIQQLLNHLIEDDAARRGGYGRSAHLGHEQMGGRHAEYHQQPPADRGYDGGYDDRRDRGYDDRRDTRAYDDRRDTRAYDDRCDTRAHDDRRDTRAYPSDDWETPPLR
ncbi:PH domain-containing protein [Blastococcus sp. Marseille-P5729]|uniref:PH domain-containing protein n=1 Tax=Blastococcus sp. Marseille-P5729 TaxID=2086582 RepID=UPI000D10EB91|nr:PH domain-containing protein [Blastococcus sp. Marseille-P5729]